MPAIEAVRRRGQSEDTQVRHEFAQRLDGRAVHALLVMGNEVAVMYEYSVSVIRRVSGDLEIVHIFSASAFFNRNTCHPNDVRRASFFRSAASLFPEWE